MSHCKQPLVLDLQRERGAGMTPDQHQEREREQDDEVAYTQTMPCSN